MTADETLAPICEGLEGVRSKGSLLEDDDASLAEEKKEVTPEEADDTSVPLANSSSSLDEDSNLDNGGNSAAIKRADTFDSSVEDNTGDGDTCPRWADVLCTPSNAAVFTPTADINSLKQNMHGWGKKVDLSLDCI
jgi:hypothetical protein